MNVKGRDLRDQIGKNDQITRAMQCLDPAPEWSSAAVEQRRDWYANTALDVWSIREAAAQSQTDAASKNVEAVEAQGGERRQNVFG